MPNDPRELTIARAERARMHDALEALPASRLSELADQSGIPVNHVVWWRERWASPDQHLVRCVLAALERMDDETL